MEFKRCYECGYFMVATEKHDNCPYCGANSTSMELYVPHKKIEKMHTWNKAYEIYMVDRYTVAVYNKKDTLTLDSNHEDANEVMGLMIYQDFLYRVGQTVGPKTRDRRVKLLRDMPKPKINIILRT